MKNKLLIFFVVVMCSCVVSVQAQEIETNKNEIRKNTEDSIDPVAPSRAAFYSAVVPGLGQIYNKKYWKLPLVYAGIGVPVYFWIDNQKNYDHYRNEYKNRLQGNTSQLDPKLAGLDDERLVDGQNFYRRNRDLSVVIAVGFYILNIVDANVDAHLMQFNVNDNLTIKPVIEYDSRNLNKQYQYAINLQYRLK